MGYERKLYFEQPQSIEELNELFARFNNIQEYLVTTSQPAKEIKDLINHGRLIVLCNILEAKGLSICYYDHVVEMRHKFLLDGKISDFYDDFKITCPEGDFTPLGIYPKNQMRMLYCDWQYIAQDMYKGAVIANKRIEMLCPEHFPKKSDCYTFLGEGIQLEVIEQDGKLLTLPDFIEVPKLPLGYASGYPDYSEKIYQEFNIPGFKFQ